MFFFEEINKVAAEDNMFRDGREVDSAFGLRHVNDNNLMVIKCVIIYSNSIRLRTTWTDGTTVGQITIQNHDPKCFIEKILKFKECSGQTDKIHTDR